MEDKELADAVVVLGVGRELPDGYFMLCHKYETTNKADKFVRDPRVAMALMEKATDTAHTSDEFYQILLGRGGDGYFCDFPDTYPDDGISAHNESLPRTIIEACIKALS